jgi:AbrB family looped-hinge helix DNA binding protein
MTTTVSSKGQITLPRFVREALGLKAGSTVSFALEPGRCACDRWFPARHDDSPPPSAAMRSPGARKRFGPM